MSEIVAEKAFDLLDHKNTVCIDVRSEGEFEKGSFPGAVNIPLLNNEHRHIVGLVYKQKGQEAAIVKGHELVDPLRASLVQRWKETLDRGQTPLLYCWRGGLRSRISCEWIREGGGQVLQVIGGFKALREISLKLLSSPPEFLVLAGMTGSGKSELLKEAPNPIDIEALAQHRGSAFGIIPQKPQPTPIDFENSLALKMRHPGTRFTVEDESITIGRCRLSLPMYQKMARSPSILLEVPVEKRAHNIFLEYVTKPLEEDRRKEELEGHYLHCLAKIHRRLGGLESQNISKMINQAFERETSFDAHKPWIESLLTKYYDKMYTHSLSKKERPLLFRGDFDACKDWLQKWSKNPSIKI